MDEDLFVVDKIDRFRSICISTLAKETVLGSNCDGSDEFNGYYIYEVDERPIIGGIHVLAKAVSIDAAIRLAEVWRDKSKPRTPRYRVQASTQATV